MCSVVISIRCPSFNKMTLSRNTSNLSDELLLFIFILDWSCGNLERWQSCDLSCRKFHWWTQHFLKAMNSLTLMRLITSLEIQKCKHKGETTSTSLRLGALEYRTTVSDALQIPRLRVIVVWAESIAVLETPRDPVKSKPIAVSGPVLYRILSRVIKTY